MQTDCRYIRNRPTVGLSRGRARCGGGARLNRHSGRCAAGQTQRQVRRWRDAAARQQVQMSSMSEPSLERGQQPMTKRAAQGRATREQLIEIATRLFAEHGYEDTSIEAVLAAAGVSRGALYHHFAGKDALFGAVVDSVENRITAELTAAIRGAPGPGPPPPTAPPASTHP